MIGSSRSSLARCGGQGTQFDQRIWDSNASNTSLWVYGPDSRSFASWNSPDKRENRPAVFVWGRPRISSDSEYGLATKVQAISQAELPDRIGRLFQARGTEAFALLEGNFSVVLEDRDAGETYLVVDMFGCDDIYIRRGSDYLAFASHPAYVAGADFTFDALAVAFYLAHEGFVPAPFTLFEGIKSLGRASFLRVRYKGDRVAVRREKYWRSTQNYELRNCGEAIEQLAPLLESATEVRRTAKSGLLLSGGTDSSLLLDIAAKNTCQGIVTMTGTVKGSTAGDSEIANARELANAMGIPHEAVIIDPADTTLPDEWQLLTESWMSGARATLPIFHRLAKRANRLLGEGGSVLSGQMADTLADNNYTFPSPGYRFRRAFYSPWTLSLLPVIRHLAPKIESKAGKVFGEAVMMCFGPRIAAMSRSVLRGLTSKRKFYEGRVFGYSEMPGRSAEYFPSLTEAGFEQVADWYSSQFVVPIVSQLTPSTFYRCMTELSLDMVMLHLDTRLVFHAFRLEQMVAELPFLDPRVVNVFVSLPNSARSIFREPKHVIRAQIRKRNVGRLIGNAGKAKSTPVGAERDAEGLLLSGSLGAYFRDLLSETGALYRMPRIFNYLEEGYALEQIRRFRLGEPGVNSKFVSRLAALEVWSQMIGTSPSQATAWATA